jgi:hypothetical protein
MRNMTNKLKITFQGQDGKHQEKLCELGNFNTVNIGAGVVPIPEAGFWFQAFNPRISNVQTQIVQVN